MMREFIVWERLEYLIIQVTIAQFNNFTLNCGLSVSAASPGNPSSRIHVVSRGDHHGGEDQGS